jgi:TfoX/Sxy family transcriptional regulator of competence genes
MAWRKPPLALIQLFDEVIPGERGIERRKMFGCPSAFLNGNLFAGVHQEDFILRLGQHGIGELQQRFATRMFEPMPGKSMREYVVVPQEVVSDRAALSAWLQKSLEYVSALPPKTAKSKQRKSKKGAASAGRASEGRRRSRAGPPK